MPGSPASPAAGLSDKRKLRALDNANGEALASLGRHLLPMRPLRSDRSLIFDQRLRFLQLILASADLSCALPNGLKPPSERF